MLWHLILLDIVKLAVCVQLSIVEHLHRLHNGLVVERICQEVCDVIVCGDLHDLDPASLDDLLDPQLLNVDMLHALAASEP